MKYLKKDLKNLFNIGDSLCTPDVYFDISSEKDLKIIGGGVWPIRKYGTDNDAPRTILWAAGESHKDDIFRYTDQVPFNYLEWSSRDRDLLKDKSKYVPCVSCFHEELFKDPQGSKTLVFTNANSAVSSKVNIKESDELLILANDASYNTFIEKWKKCDRVITNSYHGIYWSLLSGREVSPFGYSSKFTSVMRLFDLELPKTQMYNIRGRYSLNELISKQDKVFFKLNNPNEFLNNFKELNLNFVEKLKMHDVICKIKQ